MLSLDEDDYEALGFGDIQEAYVWSPVIPLIVHTQNVRQREYYAENRELLRARRNTTEGKEAKRSADIRYKATVGYKERSRVTNARYRATERHKKRDAEWRASERGKESKRKANAKYWAKKKGKL